MDKVDRTTKCHFRESHGDSHERWWNNRQNISQVIPNSLARNGISWIQSTAKRINPWLCIGTAMNAFLCCFCCHTATLFRGNPSPQATSSFAGCNKKISSTGTGASQFGVTDLQTDLYFLLEFGWRFWSIYHCSRVFYTCEVNRKQLWPLGGRADKIWRHHVTPISNSIFYYALRWSWFPVSV